jgi:hypothetical protein
MQFGAAPAATSPAGLSNLDAAAMASMIAGTLAALGNQPQQGLSMLEESSSNAGGARGAAAYTQDKSMFDLNPDSMWLDVLTKTRLQLKRHPGQPTGFEDLITMMPFGIHITKKRAFQVFAEIANAIDMNDAKRIRGLTAQALRWLTLDLDSPKDPEMAWRMMYMKDPMSRVCPSREAVEIDFNSSILDPRQLTSVLGLSRDLELLQKRLASQRENTNPRQPYKGPKSGPKEKASHK